MKPKTISNCFYITNVYYSQPYWRTKFQFFKFQSIYKCLDITLIKILTLNVMLLCNISICKCDNNSKTLAQIFGVNEIVFLAVESFNQSLKFTYKLSLCEIKVLEMRFRRILYRKVLPVLWYLPLESLSQQMCFKDGNIPYFKWILNKL